MTLNAGAVIDLALGFKNPTEPIQDREGNDLGATNIKMSLSDLVASSEIAVMLLAG